MFTKKVTDDDNFMSLSSSAQALYLHLSMSADDDGFCNQVSISMFKAHASVQDLQALLEKRYIYQFENGVIVIKHWRMANALRKDRYTPTVFKEELAMLDIKKNGSYTMSNEVKNDDNCDLHNEEENRFIEENIAKNDVGCHLVASCLPQVRLGKDSIGNNNISCAIPEESHDSFFEKIWKLYPVKKGKGQVSKAKKQTLQRIGYDEMERCIKRFVKTMEKENRDKQYWMQGSTFFNSGYVDYLDKNWDDTESSIRPNKSTKKNMFTDFEQHDYDFDDLEKRLLAKK